MRTEEELAIMALVEVLGVWAFLISIVWATRNITPINTIIQFYQAITALTFLPAIALVLAIRRFRKERKEREA